MTHGKQDGYLTPCLWSKHHGHFPAWETCPYCPPVEPTQQASEPCEACAILGTCIDHWGYEIP